MSDASGPNNIIRKIISACSISTCGEEEFGTDSCCMCYQIREIRAYGDQRERDALEKTLTIIEETNRRRVQSVDIREACDAIRAVIPKELR